MQITGSITRKITHKKLHQKIFFRYLFDAHFFEHVSCLDGSASNSACHKQQRKEKL